MPAKNKRRRTKEANPNPYGPIPMAHVGLLESRHLHPARLTSEKVKDGVVALRLLDVSEHTMEYVRNLSATIKRLTASGLQLTTVSSDLLCSLIYLTKLDLSDNKLGDNSFPECMKSLEQLLDVRLANNRLTKVPVSVRSLHRLRRLDLSDNQIVTAQGLDKLHRLRILVLDNNKLKSVFKEVATLRRLEVLRCCRNSLSEIPRDINSLTSLIDLDVSENKIKVMSTGVFLLPRLDVLVASKNEINSVPTFQVRPQAKRCLTHIDLSDNRLTRLPGHLLAMVVKLDLSNNRIRALPFHTLKKLDLNTDQQLLLTGNPLRYPPPEVCDSGLRGILSFFHEHQSTLKVHQGIKVLVVGPHESGKTSLVATLVDQQPRLVTDPRGSAGGIDLYHMTFDPEDDLQDGVPGKSLELSIWDFSGHSFYMYPHYIFFEHPSVTLLTFSMYHYSTTITTTTTTTTTFDEHIGCWIDWMLAKTNKVVMILVGTHCDTLTASQVAQVSRHVKENVARHINRRTQHIQDRIRDIEDRPHISLTLSEQLKTYIRLTQTQTIVYTDVVCTSAKDFLGFDQIRHAIEKFVSNKELFPHAMRVIPTFWLDVRHYIEDRGNAMLFPVLSWEEFQQEVTSRFGMKHLVRSIAQYLHETGQILWFSSVLQLKGLVFIRPSWLLDVLRCLLRHDLENIKFTPDDKCRSLGLTPTKFDRLKARVLSEATLDKELIQYLLSPMVSPDEISVAKDIIHLLVAGFQFGFPTDNPVEAATSAITNTSHLKTDKILVDITVPWLRKDSVPESFRKYWESFHHNLRIGCCFKFPLYFPPGLFDLMCVLAHNEKHQLHFVHQWGGGIHAVHAHEKVHVVLTYTQAGQGDGDQTKLLQFEVRDGDEDSDRQVSLAVMWLALWPLLQEFENLLEGFSGVVVERLTTCPHCRSLSFPGEWLTPRETQLLTARSCTVCKQEVDSGYLVPPREQKRVIIKRKPPAPTVTTPSSPPPPPLPLIKISTATDNSQRPVSICEVSSLPFDDKS